MEDKLYISVLSFKCNTLIEAGEALQRYLDLGLDPVLTNTDILLSASDYIKTITGPSEYIDIYNISDKNGHEILGWSIEIECRFDGVIQGKLIGRGVGCLRFIKTSDPTFLSSGIMSADRRSKEMILRMSKRLGIIIRLGEYDK